MFVSPPSIILTSINQTLSPTAPNCCGLIWRRKSIFQKNVKQLPCLMTYSSSMHDFIKYLINSFSYDTSISYDRSHRLLYRDPGSERYRTYLERRCTLLSGSHSTSVSFTMFGYACTHWSATDQTKPLLTFSTLLHVMEHCRILDLLLLILRVFVGEPQE